MRHASGTPLLVHPDLLGSMAGTEALDEVMYEGTGCEDERMLGRDEENGACTRELNEDMIGCTCDRIELIAGSYSVAIGEGTSDRDAGSETDEKESID